MKTLTSIVEGILSPEYDIEDSDIMPGVKNWPRFVGRLESFGGRRFEVETESGIKSIVYSGTGLMEALTEGLKKDIGKNITKREAENLIFDDGTLFAFFVGTEPNYYGAIYIGISEKQVYEFTPWNGDTRIRIYGPGFVSRLRTIELKNWRFKKAPTNAYNIIKQKLNLP